MKNATTTTVKNTAESHLLFAPERRIVNVEEAQRMAGRCSDYNDSRSEARDFSCREFHGITFTGEDLSGIDTTYSKFEDCVFENCRLSRMTANFTQWCNCVFKNSDLENSTFEFAAIYDTNFFNCNLSGVDMPFARGNFGATQCMMNRATAQNSILQLHFCAVDAQGFEANFAHLDLANVSKSNFRRAEFNDSVVKGRFEQCDLSYSEFNRADIRELEIIDSATSSMETEDACGNEDDALEDALNELEEGLLDE